MVEHPAPSNATASAAALTANAVEPLLRHGRRKLIDGPLIQYQTRNANAARSAAPLVLTANASGIATSPRPGGKLPAAIVQIMADVLRFVSNLGGLATTVPGPATAALGLHVAHCQSCALPVPDQSRSTGQATRQAISTSWQPACRPTPFCLAFNSGLGQFPPSFLYARSTSCSRARRMSSPRCLCGCATCFRRPSPMKLRWTLVCRSERNQWCTHRRKNR
jgi:hypothetical protein